MKNILVPTDFSSTADNALKVAATLARKTGAHLKVMHMIAKNEPSLIASDTQHNMSLVYNIKLTEQEFAKVLANPFLKDIPVSKVIKPQENFNGMDELVGDLDIDLIVMGSQGARGMQEIITGSNTERVVRNASVPVLVIKQHIPEFKLDSALFVSDFKLESVPAYFKAREFMRQFGTQVKLLYVNTPGEQFMTSKEMDSHLYKFFESAGCEDPLKTISEVTVYNDLDVEEGILNYSQVFATDLIIIPTHGHKGIKHFLNGSVAEDLCNHAPLPVMTFRI